MSMKYFNLYIYSTLSVRLCTWLQSHKSLYTVSCIIADASWLDRLHI